jgi:hypothetical protein
MGMIPNLVTTTLQLLTFRLSREAMLKWETQHLVWGLLGIWIVGMGRYWDNPRASFLQHLGVGSVIYIFCLSAFIWLIVKPLRVPDWNYKTVLIFISLTSFPAILYAIPVEKFMTIEDAISANVWFLAIVAIWRLGLLGWFLRTYVQFSGGKILVLVFLPMTAIVTALTMLNLEHVIFNIMGGLRTSERSGNDGAYGVVIGLSVISIIMVVPLFLVYLGYVYQAFKKTQ